MSNVTYYVVKSGDKTSVERRTDLGDGGYTIKVVAHVETPEEAQAILTSLATYFGLDVQGNREP